MKKITKALIAVLLIAVMSMTHVVAFATEEGISPRLSHVCDGGYSFAAYDNVGHMDVTYYGYDSFVRADLNVKIQKIFLLVFWNDVYEWNTSSTEIEGHFYHECELNGSGMYRAKFTLTVTVNDGTVDIIPFTVEDEN